MINYFASIIFAVILSGCASTQMMSDYEPPVAVEQSMVKEFDSLPKPKMGKISVAVYNFTDKTGQRRPSANVSSFSTAVTQGAESFLIKALKDVGNCEWFEVVERANMDNIIKERQLIRNTRENYETAPEALPPMLFAGILLEGAIVGYDSNVATGGSGARYFGIGAAEEYRVDTVTVALRLVSVQTGKVLLTLATEKTIASTRAGVDVFKFLDMGTKALEIENGYSINEPVNYAVREAIEAGVIEMIYAGERKGLWRFKKE